LIGAWRSWTLKSLVLIVLGGAVVTAVLLMEQLRPVADRSAELSYLPKGKYLKVAVLGYRHIAADLIWLKAVQYFGDMKQTAGGFRWAYHATDVVTDLDPEFVIAYQAGGTILGVWSGLMDESIALLKKGMRHNPNDWRFPFLIGYDYFYELCDPANGAKYFQLASTLPDAPAYLARLAARLSVEAGDPDAAIEFLEEFSGQVADPRLKDALSLRLKEVVVERDIRHLEDASRQFQTRIGRIPLRIEELVEQKIIPAVPIEPFGGRYLVLPTGAVVSTELKERLRAYRKVACPSKQMAAVAWPRG
jgi:tetratricopeptide (TPR) repeat protein